jgi:uncharacterized RDD family membrane protein YckC
MTDPAGGAPTPPPPSGNWQAPPPPQGSPQGGFNPNFQQTNVEAGPAPGITYADTTTRVIAAIIDGFIVGLISGVLGAIFGSLSVAMGGIGVLWLFIGGIVGAAVSVVYFVYGWTRMRASFGQKFFNLETVNATDGATLNQNQAIRRWAFLWGPQAILGIVWIIALFAWPLEILYALYLLYTVTQSPKRQGFHDVQAGTVVIKRG